MIVRTLLVFFVVVASALAGRAQDAYENFARQFVDNYNAQNADANYELTADGFRRQVTKEYFAQILNGVWATAGRFNSHKLVETTTQGRVFHLIAEHHTFALSVALDADNKAAGLFIKPVEKPGENSAGALLNKWQSNSYNAGLVVGKLAAEKADIQYYGVADKTTSAQLHDKSIFEIGSISKPFTGILLHTLIAEGKISLDDPVNKFLPQEAHLPKVKDKDILIKHLVTHSSCLPRMPANFHPSPAEMNNPYKHYTGQDMFAFLPKAPDTGCDIGITPSYSNLGAGLLGLILTRVSGQNYSELFDTRIARPLNTKSFGILGSSDHWVSGHTYIGALQPQWEFTDALVGAGGVDASAADLTTVLRFLMKPDQSPLGKAVAASTAEQLKSPQASFATFWIRQKVGGKNVIWHNGMTGGFNAFIGWIEGTQTGVFILSNNGSEQATAMGLAILGEAQ